MKTRCFSLFAASVSALSLLPILNSASGQELVVNPERRAVPQGTTSYQAGIYSPYPGIWAPVPYPNWNYPPHWIYSYMRPDVRGTRADEAGDGRNYRGRDTLAPAVPYSDYLRDQKSLQKSREPAKATATTEKALLEIRVPNDKAKLFFDGKEAAGEGDVRTFYTPVLTPGQTYRFTLKATWPGLLDDLSSEQTVTFQAGDHKKIDLRPKN